MTRLPAVVRRAEQLIDSSVVAASPVAGGDIATAHKLRLSNGTTALMKTLHQAPDDLFRREAEGLRWLAAVEDGVHVPEVLGVDGECLVLAWVESTKNSNEASAAFGRALATTHRAGADGFGAEHDGYIGLLPMPNRSCETWAEFYAVRRVLPYLKLARDRGVATDEHAAAIEGIIGKLPALIPDEPPARLHGDLWNGNVLWGIDPTGATGPGAGPARVSVVDPAAYGGHREVDLAMLSLFGLPHLHRVLDAYDEASPLVEGWEERLGLHQLFPLLVHACLFGGGYAERAAEVARRYA